MSFSFRPAKRENEHLLIGLAGGTGSGKTYSAMQIATGLAGEAPFAVIDTEAGRANHYAGEFRFDHGDLKPPFRPEAYAEAILAADKAGYPVIVVDSASHEHAGDGGLLDWHEEEFQRMGARDAVKMTAWIKPKQAHKKFVSQLLQIRSHLILCFRAEEKVEMVKDDKGKWQVVPKATRTGLNGWVPICEKNLPFEMTLSFLLTADKPGIPQPIKLQHQHRALVPLEEPLGVETGKRLGEWAHGSSLDGPPDPDAVVSQTPRGASPGSGGPSSELLDELLGLVMELGADESVPNIKEHFEAGDTAWIERQIVTAKAAVAAKSGADPPNDGRENPESVPLGAEVGSAAPDETQGSFFEQRLAEAQERRAARRAPRTKARS
jgi:hypothetical protein